MTKQDHPEQGPPTPPPQNIRGDSLHGSCVWDGCRVGCGWPAGFVGGPEGPQDTGGGGQLIESCHQHSFGTPRFGSTPISPGRSWLSGLNRQLLGRLRHLSEPRGRGCPQKPSPVSPCGGQRHATRWRDTPRAARRRLNAPRAQLPPGEPRNACSLPGPRASATGRRAAAWGDAGPAPRAHGLFQILCNRDPENSCSGPRQGASKGRRRLKPAWTSVRGARFFSDQRSPGPSPPTADAASTRAAPGARTRISAGPQHRP